MKIQALFLSTVVSVMAPSALLANLKVVTTTEDLAALAQEVGGDLVDVTHIAHGHQDPHFVEAKPSFLLKLRKADLFIQVGLELEVAWAPPLLTNARNPKILPNHEGFLEASEGCDILEKTAGRVDRSMGDAHPFGNPHFWLDPENGRIMARNIAQKLEALDADHAKVYQANLARFESKLTEKEKEWDAMAAPIKGSKAVTYHNSWPNFAKRFGIEVANFIEPRPGVPASPLHVEELINQIRKEKIPLILVEPYFDTKLPQKIADQTGAKLMILMPSVAGAEQIRTYFDLFDYDLKLLRQGLQPKE